MVVEVQVEQMRDVIGFGLRAIYDFVRYCQRRDGASFQTAGGPLTHAPVYYRSPHPRRYRPDAFRRPRLD
jgi:hypothetical protein